MPILDNCEIIAWSSCCPRAKFKGISKSHRILGEEWKRDYFKVGPQVANSSECLKDRGREECGTRAEGIELVGEYIIQLQFKSIHEPREVLAKAKRQAPLI